MNNDEKIRKYKFKKRLKWYIIILSIAVVVLEALALCNVISMFWGFIPFIMVYILKKIFQNN